MKFNVEQKGEKFLVVNDTSGVVRGVHKSKGEADAQAKDLQKEHDLAVKHAGGRLTPQENAE